MKNKVFALLIFCFAIMAEYFHLLFSGIIHSYYIRNGIKTVIYLDDMVYYAVNESFILLLIIIAYVKIGINPASKAIMISVVFWFFVEWMEIMLQLFKINDSRIYINDGSWLQLFTCLTVSGLVLFFGSKK